MKKLPAVKAKEVATALERAGFSFVGQKGSHRIYAKEQLRLTIPFRKKELKKGTLAHIIKQSGLTQEKFFELLEQ